MLRTAGSAPGAGSPSTCTRGQLTSSTSTTRWPSTTGKPGAQTRASQLSGSTARSPGPSRATLPQPGPSCIVARTASGSRPSHGPAAGARRPARPAVRAGRALPGRFGVPAGAPADQADATWAERRSWKARPRANTDSSSTRWARARSCSGDSRRPGRPRSGRARGREPPGGAVPRGAEAPGPDPTGPGAVPGPRDDGPGTGPGLIGTDLAPGPDN